MSSTYNRRYMMNYEFDISIIAKEFDLAGEFIEAIAITDGNINRTYKISFDDNGEIKHYLLQIVNTYVFKNPEELMENIVAVTAFLRDKIIARGGNPDRETLTFLKASNGKHYFIDEDGKCFRVCNYVIDSHSYNTLDDPEIYRRAGAAFGDFNNLLADFDGTTLYETIPMFHNTRKRFNDLLLAIDENAVGRLNEVRAEVDWALSKEQDASKLVDMIERGELPIRVTHNDTKLNNILFDDKTNEAVCIIDLDTIMPGLSLYDFGDSIRFAANTASENETDLSKVGIDLDLYEAYVEGFLGATGKTLTQNEVDNLAFSCKLMAYECGMRFLTDYLNGDVYFKINYPTHNLDRCRCQFKLASDIENKMPIMEQITREYYSKL